MSEFCKLQLLLLPFFEQFSCDVGLRGRLLISWLISARTEHLGLTRATFQENGVKPHNTSDFIVSRQPCRIFLGICTAVSTHFPAGIDDDSDSIKLSFEMSFGGFVWVREPITARCGPHVISLMSALLQWSKDRLMVIHSTGHQVSQNAHLHAQHSVYSFKWSNKLSFVQCFDHGCCFKPFGVG